MFSIATTKGRFASLALVLLALTMVACPGINGEPLVDSDGYYVNDDGAYVDENGVELDDGQAVEASTNTLVDLDALGAEVDAGVEVDAGIEGDVAADCESGTTCDDTGAECEGDTCDEGAFGSYVYAYTFDSCHDYNTAGGASDGVISGTIPNAPAGAVVTFVLKYDDDTTQTATGTVGEDGSVVVVFPLHFFGEVITVVSAEIGGEVIDLASSELELTVQEASVCDAHPSNG